MHSELVWRPAPHGKAAERAHGNELPVLGNVLEHRQALGHHLDHCDCGVGALQDAVADGSCHLGHRGSVHSAGRILRSPCVRDDCIRHQLSQVPSKQHPIGSHLSRTQLSREVTALERPTQLPCGFLRGFEFRLQASAGKHRACGGWRDCHHAWFRDADTPVCMSRWAVEKQHSGWARA